MATFAKIVDLNSFTAAAHSLKVPKAAVSRSLRELEGALGVRLLERTTRRIHLTPAGEVLLPHCRRLLEETGRAREAAAQLSQHHEGPLRVLAEASWGRPLLMPLVPRFLERFGQFTLDIALGIVDDDPLAEHWDVALCAGRRDDEAMITRVLGAPPAILCVAPAYLQKRGLPTHPEQLEAHDVLTPATADARYVLRLTLGLRRAEVALVPKLAMNDPALLHTSVVAGLGIGLLPEFLCRQGLVTHKLIRVLPEWQLPEQAPLCAVFPARLAQDARVAAWVDFLAANLVPALAPPKP
jgi:LysR family transcriptional regulator AphB